MLLHDLTLDMYGDFSNTSLLCFPFDYQFSNKVERGSLVASFLTLVLDYYARMATDTVTSTW